eukprot:404420_1
MTKRMKYFRYYVRGMYGMIGLMVVMYFIGFLNHYGQTGAVESSFIGTVFSTIVISRIAVSQLRTTNEIHFTYDIPQNNEHDFTKPILLTTPKKCCGVITAEDMFERLEEAVSVYSITNNDYLLKEILTEPNDDEITRLMNYYRYI